MGVYHDALRNRRSSKRAGAGFANNCSMFFSVPLDPSSDYYLEVVDVFEEESFMPFFGYEYEEDVEAFED